MTTTQGTEADQIIQESYAYADGAYPLRDAAAATRWRPRGCVAFACARPPGKPRIRGGGKVLFGVQNKWSSIGVQVLVDVRVLSCGHVRRPGECVCVWARAAVEAGMAVGSVGRPVGVGRPGWGRDGDSSRC